jgi:hypothetical protein
VPSPGRVAEIKEKLESGFLSRLLIGAQVQSASVQQNFTELASALAAQLRELMESEGLIHSLSYRPREFWPSLKGNEFCFVDGGVARLNLPTSAPMGIRVGAYYVKPGEDSNQREHFEFHVQLVDELYSETRNTYEDDFSDIQKLQDAARIIAEAAGAYQAVKAHPHLGGLYLHGPLVNPVSPYGLEDFPAFSQAGCKCLLGDDYEVPADKDDRHFVGLYCTVLSALKESNVPVFGIVERSAGGVPGIVTRAFLDQLSGSNKLSLKDRDSYIDLVTKYRLTDPILFLMILSPNEYFGTIPVDKQGPNHKRPEYWKPKIAQYPNAHVAYMSITANSLPVRIEGLRASVEGSREIDLIFHMSRLLPGYAFPVGLDIVDKYAKVPNWMSRSVTAAHATALLKKAIRSGDPKIISFAKRVLSTKGRDWLFRPTAEL